MNRQFLDELYLKYFEAKSNLDNFNQGEHPSQQAAGVFVNANAARLSELNEIIDDYIKMHSKG